jgi:hypothetical protein
MFYVKIKYWLNIQTVIPLITRRTVIYVIAYRLVFFEAAKFRKLFLLPSSGVVGEILLHVDPARET